MGPRPLGPRRNSWTASGKASKLLADHLITGLSLPRKSGKSFIDLLGWLYI